MSQQATNKQPQKVEPIQEIMIWIQAIQFEQIHFAFEKIKRNNLKIKLKKLNKNNFESVSSSSQNNYTTGVLTNYVSISDFKPIDQNYSSIKIVDYQTYGVAKDVQSHIAQKISFTSSQIMNKETFLQSWMIREKIDVLRPQYYPMSDYAIKKIQAYHQDALISVRKFTFTYYCKFNLKKKRGFFSLIQSDPLKYKSVMINSSLTYLADRQNQIALEVFELLLQAGGQMQSKYNYLNDISQIIEIMFKSNDNIKEEVFLQVVKQISSKKEIYVRILCCLCYCVKVSTRIYIPLLNFLYEDATLYQYIQKELLNYCFFHLIKNFQRQRQYPPCLQQLFCAFNCRKIPIIISFPKEKTFFIESYTTVEQFLDQIIQYYNLDKNIEYLLELNGFLMEKGNLLDCYNNFCQLQEEEDYKWTDYKQYTGFRGIIVLKNINDINKSPRSFNIMYNYGTQQYLRGVYSLRSTDIVRIGALKMHSEINDEQNYHFQYQNLITKRKLRLIDTEEQKLNYKKHILRMYYKILYMSKIDARKEIISILSKSKGFNTHFFKSDIYIEQYDEFSAWVGIQKDRFIIVEPSTGRIMRIIMFNKIIEWGNSKSELCLKLDDIGSFNIICKQVQVLTSIFKSYIDYHTAILRELI